MKNLLAFLLVPIAALAAPPQVTWTIQWWETNNVPILTQYVPKTNFCYFIVGTNNVASPLTSWPTLAQVTSWNLVTNGQKVFYATTIQVPADNNYFFSVYSSNVWGQVTPPFSVDQTGPPSSLVSFVGLSR